MNPTAGHATNTSRPARAPRGGLECTLRELRLYTEMVRGRRAARDPQFRAKLALLRELGEAVRACESYLLSCGSGDDFGRDARALCHVMHTYTAMLEGEA